jgi:hypothetical protein
MNDQTKTEFRVAGVDGWATDIIHEALKRAAPEAKKALEAYSPEKFWQALEKADKAIGKPAPEHGGGPPHDLADEVLVPLEARMNSMLHNQARIYREDAIATARRTADILGKQIKTAKQGGVTVSLGSGDSIIAHPAFTAEADARLVDAVVAELERDHAAALWVLEALETSSMDLSIKLESAQ